MIRKQADKRLKEMEKKIKKQGEELNEIPMNKHDENLKAAMA